MNKSLVQMPTDMYKPVTVLRNYLQWWGIPSRFSKHAFV